MPRRAGILLLLALPLAAIHAMDVPDDDEHVVFFPTAAWRDAASGSWQVPVHGWIHEPEQDSVARGAVLGFLARMLDLGPDAASSAIFQSRMAAFLVDNERDHELAITIGPRRITLPPSDSGGHFRATLALEPQDVRRATVVSGPGSRGRLEFELVTGDEDGRRFRGAVDLIERVGASVVSDIDDTIKVSEVRDHNALLENTFLREFEPVAGMADLYTRWREAGAAFHYVSASPWQLHAPLLQMLREHGFPEGAMHQKRFRFKDSTFFALFADPVAYKLEILEPILSRYPERSFTLVGDSGEKDPEIYGILARKHPGQVARILIRNVSEEDSTASRYAAAFADLPRELWHVFTAPGQIPPLAPVSPDPGERQTR